MKILISLVIFLSSLAYAGIPKGVDWHKGSVESAFKLAKEQNKPLFLYWGAIWCPPCNHIKKKVFTNPSFQKEVKNFIAVYLDGDTDRAQIWGEKLKASGYPTMMVMTPAGRELMRFPTTIDARIYTELLRSSKKRKISIEELLKKKHPSAEEWSQLAFYSWAQNRDIKDKLGLYEKLYNKIPLRFKFERTALLLKYLEQLTKDKKTKRLKTPLGKEFVKLINQKVLARGFTGTLAYSGGKYIDYLFDDIQSRIRHHKKLRKLLEELSTDKKLSVEERLFSLSYEMNIALEDEKLLPEFQKKLLLKVEETDREAKDGYTRQDAMSTVIWILKKSKLLKEAKSYAEKELSKSIAPYYFMSYLASIEKELGNPEAQLAWSRKAWEASKGGSTRFQWGTSYLRTMIDNNKKKNFAKDFKAIISELLKQPDAFSGRNKKRLERLQKSLAKLKDKTFNLRIKAILLEECSKLKDGKSCHKSFKSLKLI
ncbi:MAG: hypothetical protein CME70_04950 [Halobacteriovorax sp.]|nr:hypothetical protein [Halobacteriovorax sp.]|tara:strand:+ start:10333 stop:11781 length:1449 start_codon:yes stop_codon:yes gene_type:complete